MKPQVVVQRVMDSTVLEENSHRTPTVLGHQLEDLLKAVTVLAVPAVVVALLIMVMLVAEVATAGDPHTGLAKELVIWTSLGPLPRWVPGPTTRWAPVSYGPPWAHYLGGYQDRLLGGPLGLPDLCRMVPDGVMRKDYGGEVLG
jgi:hypothetical protein